nr:hypothetical protein BN993_06621 [Virgibacillus halodenitrificans]
MDRSLCLSMYKKEEHFHAPLFYIIFSAMGKCVFLMAFFILGGSKDDNMQCK